MNIYKIKDQLGRFDIKIHVDDNTIYVYSMPLDKRILGHGMLYRSLGYRMTISSKLFPYIGFSSSSITEKNTYLNICLEGKVVYLPQKDEYRLIFGKSMCKEYTDEVKKRLIKFLVNKKINQLIQIL